MKTIEKCPHCYAKMIKYTHSLSSGALAKILLKFYSHTEKGTKAVNPSKIDLTKNEYNNFQKLGYWRVVKRDGHGSWMMTYLGIEFVLGRADLYSKVVTYRGDFEEFKGNKIKIYDVKSLSYMKANDYLKESENLNSEQLKFA